MEGLVCKASRLGPSPTDKGAPLWGFSSENHMIKSAFREITLAMAQRMDWRRESTRGKSGRRLEGRSRVGWRGSEKCAFADDNVLNKGGNRIKKSSCL